MNQPQSAAPTGTASPLTDTLRPLIGAHADVTANHLLASDWHAGLIREAKAEALREAADAMAGGQHSCVRPQGCVECGRQHERDGRAQWLRARADRIEATR